MTLAISHDRAEESPEAKARWFQSLPVSERMAWLCWMTDLILTYQPQLGQRNDAQSLTGRVLILTESSG